MNLEHHVSDGSGGQTGEATAPGKVVEEVFITPSAGRVRVMHVYSLGRHV